MTPRQILVPGLSIVLIFLAGLACIRRTPSNLPPLEVGLYTGIEQVAKLDESEAQVSARTQFSPEKLDVTDADLIALKFTSAVHFKDVGVKAYFRKGRVALIEVQEPFAGGLQGKKYQLFPFGSQKGKSWQEVITREFGSPQNHNEGGRFSSESLAYSWGDISYNGNGPNQLALYRDPEVAQYRQKNFGRVIQFWPK